MSAPVEPLILDLLEWLAREERSYADTMEAWRTSCPRLPVWEEANARGLVARVMRDGRPMVELTRTGRALMVAPRA
jgi:D-3-phosphoglycerate dehydrogenase